MQQRRWVKNEKEHLWTKYEWRLEPIQRFDTIIGIGFHSNYTSSNRLTLFLQKEFGVWTNLKEELNGKIPGYDGRSIGSSGDDITITIQIPENCNKNLFIRDLAEAIAKFSHPLSELVVNDICINWNVPPIHKVPSPPIHKALSPAIHEALSLKDLCLKHIQYNFSLFKKHLEKSPTDDIENFLLFNNNNKVDLAILPFKSIAKYIEGFFNELTGINCFSRVHLGYSDDHIHMDVVCERFVNPIINVLVENKIAYSIEKRKVHDKFDDNKKVDELAIMTANNNADKLVLILKAMICNKQKIVFPLETKSNITVGWIIKSNTFDSGKYNSNFQTTCGRELKILNEHPEAKIKQVTFFRRTNGDVMLGICFKLNTADPSYFIPCDKSILELFLEHYKSLTIDETKLVEKPIFSFNDVYNFSLTEKSFDQAQSKSLELPVIRKMLDIIQMIDPIHPEILNTISNTIPNIQENNSENNACSLSLKL